MLAARLDELYLDHDIVNRSAFTNIVRNDESLLLD